MISENAVNEAAALRIYQGVWYGEGRRPATTRMREKREERSCFKNRTAPEVEQSLDPTAAETVRGRLVRLAYRFLWNHDDAEEVAQDALAIALQKAGELRDRRKWWSWICAVVVQRCRERGRRVQRWKRHEDTYRAELSPGTGGPEALDDDDARHWVRELLLQLPRRQQEVMVLRHLQEMSYDEISEVLGISAATARVHARAGREALRGQLLARHPDWFARPGAGGGGRP